MFARCGAIGELALCADVVAIALARVCRAVVLALTVAAAEFVDDIRCSWEPADRRDFGFAMNALVESISLYAALASVGAGVKEHALVSGVLIVAGDARVCGGVAVHESCAKGWVVAYGVEAVRCPEIGRTAAVPEFLWIRTGVVVIENTSAIGTRRGTALKRADGAEVDTVGLLVDAVLARSADDR
jgi:hypothetical protein